MRQILTTLIIAGLLIFAGLACFNDAGVNPGPRDGNALVTGQVRATWYIFGGGPQTDLVFPGDMTGYNQLTGYDATVIFTHSDGTITSVLTDDSSNYGLELDTGHYTMTVETWHSWPRTIGEIEVRRDSLIDAELWLDYFSPDTLVCFFDYESKEDSLGEETERYHMNTLALFTGSKILPDQARREFWDNELDWAWAVYYVPVATGNRVWEVCDECWRDIGRYPGLFPTEMSVQAMWPMYDYITAD
jgi:hypothetical protein